MGSTRLSPPLLEIADGKILTGPLPPEGKTLGAQDTARWTFRVELGAEAKPRLAGQIRASCPKETLVEVVRNKYVDAREAALRNLETRIQSLPQTQTLRIEKVLDIGPFEGIQDQQSPVYRGYTPGPEDGARLAYWKPAQTKGTRASAAALATASPRLRKLLIQAGVRSEPVSPETTYRSLLDRFETKNETNSLIPDLLSFVKTGPNRSTYAAQNLLGIIQVQLGQFKAAKQTFQNLTSQEGERAYAWYNLGEVHQALVELEEAQRAYQKAFRLRKAFRRARKRWAQAKKG